MADEPFPGDTQPGDSVADAVTCGADPGNRVADEPIACHTQPLDAVAGRSFPCGAEPGRAYSSGPVTRAHDEVHTGPARQGLEPGTQIQRPTRLRPADIGAASCPGQGANGRRWASDGAAASWRRRWPLIAAPVRPS